jgi:hypothetical protein
MSVKTKVTMPDGSEIASSSKSMRADRKPAFGCHSRPHDPAAAAQPENAPGNLIAQRCHVAVNDGDNLLAQPGRFINVTNSSTLSPSTQEGMR